jgi:hypothetical protein
MAVVFDRTDPLAAAEPEPDDVVEAEVVEEPTPIQDGPLIKADRADRMLRHDELHGPTDTEHRPRKHRGPADIRRG